MAIITIATKPHRDTFIKNVPDWNKELAAEVYDAEIARYTDYIRDYLSLYGGRLVVDNDTEDASIFSIEAEGDPDGIESDEEEVAYAASALRRALSFRDWRDVAPAPVLTIDDLEDFYPPLEVVKPDPELYMDDETFTQIHRTLSRLREHIKVKADPACVEAAARLSRIIDGYEKRIFREQSIQA